MAVVYRAWDRALQRPCALKVLSDVLSQDDEFRRRFRREAEAAQGLTHPHIVAVYDCGEAGSHHYIAMEYVAGGTLRNVLRRRRVVGEAEALRIASEVADALAYAHSRSVVHRDIKPHNVLLTEEGSVKVADFGIARTLDATGLTRTGGVFGSAHYLSPEQARGDPAGPRSDLYALGVLLYEMLAGRVPFEGEAPVAVALKHLHESPPDLHQIRPDLSPATVTAVRRLLAKVERDRYETAAALAADLRRIASGISDEGEGRWDVSPAHAAGEAISGTALLPGLPLAEEAPATGLLAVPPTLAEEALATTVRLPELSPRTERARPSPTAMFPERTSPKTGADETTTRVRAGVLVACLLVMALAAAVGLPVLTGSVIRVTVNLGSVPDLRGMTIPAAAARLRAAGLHMGSTSYLSEAQNPPGTVIEQSYPPGAKLEPRTPVDIVVSEGSPPVLISHGEGGAPRWPGR